MVIWWLIPVTLNQSELQSSEKLGLKIENFLNFSIHVYIVIHFGIFLWVSSESPKQKIHNITQETEAQCFKSFIPKVLHFPQDPKLFIQVYFGLG